MPHWGFLVIEAEAEDGFVVFLLPAAAMETSQVFDVTDCHRHVATCTAYLEVKVVTILLLGRKEQDIISCSLP